jgi:hypothetical protein
MQKLVVKMADAITTLFTSTDLLMFIITLGFSLILAYISMIKKTKMPIFIIMLNFTMLLLASVILANANPLYFVLIVFAVSGLTVFMANNMFFGNMGNLDKIFFSYLFFFLTSMFFLNTTAIATNVFGNQFSGNTTMTSCVFSPNNTPIIGGLIHFADVLVCNLMNLSHTIGVFMSINSSLGIINFILIGTFIILCIMYFIDKVKP